MAIDLPVRKLTWLRLEGVAQRTRNRFVQEEEPHLELEELVCN